MHNEMLIGVLGGLALFLYGMNLMGTGLQKAAGEKMKKLIEVLTNNRFMGVLVGAVVTMLVQSSSATTVMVVGFVNAGMMTLVQAIGVIMGANIGTTITAQMIAFKLTDVAPFVIAIGVFIWLASSKKKHKEIAEIFIGFGILFLGMGMMSEAMVPLRDNEAFRSMMTNLKNPVLGILAGFIITAIVQSSSATTGMLLALAAAGLVSDVGSVLPILFGQNIGTCVTAMISSIGASKTAKRAAFMHLTFNVLGTAIFMTLLLFLPISNWIEMSAVGDIPRQIANAHTLFNIVNTIVLFPFATVIVKISETVIRGKDEEVEGLKYLDSRIIETPSIAVVMASKEVLRMGKIVNESLNRSKNAIINLDAKDLEYVLKKEKQINALERDIIQYLSELLNAPLTDHQHVVVTTLLNAVNDLERVGDHAENIVELAQYRIDNKVKLSASAVEELEYMFDRVSKAYTISLNAFKAGDNLIAEEVFVYEDEIDKLEKEYRSNHIKRLNDKGCNATAGIVFLDTISNLERIGDHASNIAEAVIEGVKKS